MSERERVEIKKVVFHLLCGEEGYTKRKVTVKGSVYQLIMKHARTLTDLVEFLDLGEWSDDE